MFVEEGDELGLGVAGGADAFEDGGEDLGLDLEGASFGGGEAQGVEDVSFNSWVGLFSTCYTGAHGIHPSD